LTHACERRPRSPTLVPSGILALTTTPIRARRRSASAYSAAAPGLKTGGPNRLTVGDGLLWRLPRECARMRSSSARSAASISPMPGASQSHVTSLGDLPPSSGREISGASSPERSAASERARITASVSG
jgi:hypothetical protein